MLWTFSLRAVLLVVGLAAAAGAAELPLPARPAGAPTGSQFYAMIENLSRDAREVAIWDEVVRGNIPPFQRVLKPVTVTATLGGTSRTLVYHVVPDYIAIGSNEDYFRMPMTPILAQWIADRTRCMLPTAKMVNDIWSASTVRIAPSTIPPGAAMVTVPVFWAHNTAVQGQRSGIAAALGALVGGTKKDVVITPLLYQAGAYQSPLRVAIYGWHYTNGTTIQPQSLIHENTYVDYSHGVRLVLSEATLNGQPTTLQAVLADAVLAPLLTTEGVFAQPRYPQVGSPPIGFPYRDAFPAGSRELGGAWVDRFKTPTLVSFTPAAPGGDGTVLVVRDTSGGIDTTRLGRATDSDYFVECDIYCDYRPALAGDGFDRVGIFMRDDGNGLFTGQNAAGTVRGNNYALAWDSNTGRIQCLKTVAGVPTDLLATTRFVPTSGWRTFRMEARGANLTFKLDAETLLTTTDGTFPTGQFGIGYQELFTTNTNILGTRADLFFADSIPGGESDRWELQ